MKKIAVFPLIAAVALAGCGKKKQKDPSGDNNTTTTTAVTSETVAATETEAVSTTAASSASAETTGSTETSPVTSPPITTAAQPDEALLQSFYQDLKPMLSLYFEDLLKKQKDSGYMEYAFYDVTKDGVPEFIIKSGMSEADFEIKVFAEDGFDGCYQIGETYGSHTNCYYDTAANDLVFVSAMMGKMVIRYTGMEDYKLKEVNIVEKDLSSDGDFDSVIADGGLKALTYVSVYKADANSEGYSIIHHADGTEERKEGLYFVFTE
ncbi:MAG: hypothetical protein K6G33_14780 [Ruminococcus sp.]|uniref:hypothetical protein n=1 Tax=Ruminococcus sp. TaxID=41978 RepID=UPI0025F525D7|nr:hypothetical protein [Ruminococcus sp.]MCR5601989.1 hypothetical protein [Ruminococcus sp.]